MTTKLVMVLLTAACAQAWAKSYAQKVTIHVKQQPISQVLDLIQQQTGYDFLYNAAQFNVSKPVDLNFRDTPIETVLTACFQGQPLTFQIDDKTVLILRSKDTPTPQQRSITGQVTDASGAPLAGVSISIEGATGGTTSNAEGKYQLNITGPANIVVFTMMGYQPARKTIGTASQLNVTLSAAISDLDEVVVVGYGTQRKSDVTGAVSSIKASDVEKTPFPRADQALQGKTAGVVVSNFGFQPGGQVNIRVRGGNSINGSNNPLIVVDGIFDVDFNSVNPSDIESMEVLKDASATAIYGSRGANGVIIISTKRGKAGSTQIGYHTFFSWAQVAKRMDLLNANEQYQLMEATGNYTDLLKTVDRNVNTDWQSQAFQTGPTMDHQVELSGGNEKTQFRLSGNYYNQNGVIKKTGYERGTLRLNLDHQISKRVKTGVNMNLIRSGQDNTIINAGAGSDGGGVTQVALRFSPMVPVYNDQGGYSSPLLVGSQLNHPLAIINDRKDKQIKNDLQALLYVDWKIFDKLSFKTNISYSQNQLNRRYWAGSTLLEAAGQGAATIENTERTFWLSENVFNYADQFGEHRIEATAGFTAQGTSDFTSNSSGRGFPTESLEYYNIGLANISQMRIGSGANSSNLASYLGRINYAYSDRYLLTISARADGSSKFARNNKWGYFPSAALGWRIDREAFMANASAISNLKLRASYGATGSEAISSYQSLSTYGTTTYSLATSELIALNLGRVANPNLKWETTYQTNIGLDFGLFNNRISLTADYFDKRTKNLLYPKNVPEYSGYSTQLQNIGNMSNKGWELALGTANTIGTFKWNTSANVSYYQNKILNLGDDYEYLVDASGGTIADFSTTGVMRVGEPAGVFYGYVFDGIYQNAAQVSALPAAGAKPGSVKFKDLDGDGQITTADRTIIGNPQPKFVFGMTNDFEYKNWTLSVALQGSAGNDIFNINRYLLEWGGREDNTLRSTLNYWQGEGTSNTMQALGEAPGAMSSRFIESGSYLRLQNVLLSYQLTPAWVRQIGLQNIKIYVSGQNLATITGYSGFDPEVNSRSGNWQIGIDYGAYPSARTYTVGLNVGF